MVFSSSLATLLLYFFLASAQSALWLDLDQTPNKGLHILLRSAFTTYCKSCLPVCNHLLCYNIYNRAPQTLCTSGRMARSLTGKKTSPNDASYRPQMPSLIDTFHIQLKSREDMGRPRRARACPPRRPDRWDPCGNTLKTLVLLVSPPIIDGVVRRLSSAIPEGPSPTI